MKNITRRKAMMFDIIDFNICTLGFWLEVAIYKPSEPSRYTLAVLSFLFFYKPKNILIKSTKGTLTDYKDNQLTTYIKLTLPLKKTRINYAKVHS